MPRHVDRSRTAQRQIRQLLGMLAAHGHSGIPNASQVSAQNRQHGPTATGGRSDHQGPRNYAWAADLPVGSLLEGDRLAAAVADFLGLSAWQGGGILDHTHGSYRYQLIWRAPGHDDHVHIGIRRLGDLPRVSAAFV